MQELSKNIPLKMQAYVIRSDRLGEPIDAMQKEVVKVPEIGPYQVLVYVMASGVNRNNVFASLGKPIDVIEKRKKINDESDHYHIGGSDCSGIVVSIGDKVTDVAVNDHVIISCSVVDNRANDILTVNDPLYSYSQRIWGYETNFGSFAEYTLVESHQCHPKPDHLSWEESASILLCGATTYRQLTSWHPNIVRPGDPVLVWGGAGGLGSMAIQIVRALGGIPVAVVSSSSKAQYVLKLGAKGVLNRNDYPHLQVKSFPEIGSKEHKEWLESFSQFRKDFCSVLGERKLPRIVLEHPGQYTFPTSLHMCDIGGMVVICGGTTGYNCSFDVRHLWMHQKRIQGSHFANFKQCQEFVSLVNAQIIKPSLGKVYSFDEVPLAHQDLFEEKDMVGNQVIDINLKGIRA